MLFAIPLQLLGMFGSTVSILGTVVGNGMAVSNAILLPQWWRNGAVGPRAR